MTVAVVSALQWLRGCEDVTADMEEMETECTDQADDSPDGDSAAETYTMKMLLTAKDLRLPLLIAVMLQVSQQLSGINAVSLTTPCPGP